MLSEVFTFPQQIHKSKLDTMVGKMLQFDLKILKWFRRRKRFQGIWNLLAFYLCEVAAIYLFDDYIAAALISIPKSHLFDSMPSAQLQRNSFQFDFSPTLPSATTCIEIIAHFRRIMI